MPLILGWREYHKSLESSYFLDYMIYEGNLNGGGATRSPPLLNIQKSYFKVSKKM
jgi:hypothetical protein